jgi:hypothetical protein
VYRIVAMIFCIWWPLARSFGMCYRYDGTSQRSHITLIFSIISSEVIESIWWSLTLPDLVNACRVSLYEPNNNVYMILKSNC